ncbi:peptidoglycan recognition protein family protein [Nocardioides jensenii]|uniref:peptidoglycan recognition protein family protein n=1 Tax=Nocardioides jensenii TaxID=1843 RepID=UPI00082C7539|nr:N-acetylmuramoyl-L-alanine amidase [Nocardioides jensenii]
MTYRYLTDLAEVLRTTGHPVIELPGWKSNGHPGTFDPQGNLWHHTGSYDALADAPDDLSYAKWLAFEGRSDLAGPLCNVSISAEGVYYVCAAGRAYHAGDAKASGPVPAGNGNGLYIGWECMNSGSQGWGRPQLAAMVDGAAVTSQHYGWTAVANRAHKETSLTGKWDPGLLDMDEFRDDIKIAITNNGRTWFDMATEKELRAIIREELPTAVRAELERLFRDEKGAPSIGNARIEDPDGGTTFTLARRLKQIEASAGKEK